MDPDKISLIERMGGAQAASGVLVSAVEMFYFKMVSDPQLKRFFEGVDVPKLMQKQVDCQHMGFCKLSVTWEQLCCKTMQSNAGTWYSTAALHCICWLAMQVLFLSYVFGGPDKYVGRNLAEAHARLIDEQGLDVTHFDLLAGHFRSTLEELSLGAVLIEEAMAIMATARPIFERKPHGIGVAPKDEASQGREGPGLPAG